MLPAVASAGVQPGFSIKPVIGLSHYVASKGADPGFNLVLGAAASGQLRSDSTFGLETGLTVRFEGLLGADRIGYEFRAEAIVGPKLGPFSILTGVGFYDNRYTLDGDFYQDNWSFNVPIMGRLNLSIVEIQGGVSPGWFLAEGRRAPVNWQESWVKGFGDEMDILASIGVYLGPIKLGVSSRTRVAQWGILNTYYLGVAYGKRPGG